VTRFQVTPLLAAGRSVAPRVTEVMVDVQFKLESPLMQWRNNLITLTAPVNFTFVCHRRYVNISYVDPKEFLLPVQNPSVRELFGDLSAILLQEPAAGTLQGAGVSGGGTPEDNRVDCKAPSLMVIAIDYTDLRQKGRYAFQTRVLTPASVVPPNVWSLQTSSGEGVLDFGTTDGFELGHYFVPTVMAAAFHAPVLGALVACLGLHVLA